MPFRFFVVLLNIVFLASFPFPALAQKAAMPPRVLDAVAGAIGYQVIPLTMLRAYQRTFSPRQSLRMALVALIDERLLATEARRYALQLGPGDLDRARTQHPAPAGIEEGEWDSLLADRLYATRFVAFRFGDTIPVSNDQVRALLARFPERFTGTPQQNEAQARVELKEMRINVFKRDLRARSSVRMVDAVVGPNERPTGRDNRQRN